MKAQMSEATEYEVKAAFLYNFARFVAWPSEAFPAKDAPIRICTVGEDSFGRDLERTVSGKQVDGHPVLAVRLRDLPEARTCHILFIGSRDSGRLKQLLSITSGRSVLEQGLAGRHLMILTAKNSAADILSGLRAGANDYVTKPFDPEELRARVRVGKRGSNCRMPSKTRRDW